MNTNRNQKAENLSIDWASNPRWEHVERPYSADEVLKLRGWVEIE